MTVTTAMLLLFRLQIGLPSWTREATRITEPTVGKAVTLRTGNLRVWTLESRPETPVGAAPDQMRLVAFMWRPIEKLVEES